MRMIAVYCIVWVTLSVHVQAQSENADWKMQPVKIQTRWAKDVDPRNVLPEYPRPRMVRNNWTNLNGLWEYAITDKNTSKPSRYDGRILVPFPIESALSGVMKPLLPDQYLWYKRNISKPGIKGGKRVLLHFGAADWETTVYVNGKEIGEHAGGYQHFSFDITDALEEGNNELTIRVKDPTDQGPNPHGKQVLKPQNIMYTASSGIWQTVWLETVPTTYISGLRMTPDVDNNQLYLQITTTAHNKDHVVEIVASNGQSVKGAPGTRLRLPVPDAHLWSPDDPYLYDLNVRLLYKGKIVDTVGSYFGMRKIEIKKDSEGIDRLFLNNKYTYHLGVLDQGFWPEGLYTAPTDSALQFDIMAIRNMGYNTIRKHIKLEPDRWYYYADKMGMLVWQDMVTCANESPEAQHEFEKENKENIEQLYNYPSIVVWVLFNEGWARYDQERLTKWMKEQDPSRIINGHTGENYDRGAPQNVNEKWAASDLTDIHDYPGPGIPPALPGKARVLGEWGGVRVVTPKHQWNGEEGWGYIQVPAAQFARRYEFMLKHLKIYEEEGLSGSIYTEPFDVETEENGMMTYDRELIKIPAEKLRSLHKMLLPQAENYAAAPGVFKAQLADTANAEKLYAIRLEDYRKGNRERSFLRELALDAIKMNDDDNVAKIVADYTAVLTAPYNRNDLSFIQRVTRRSSDPGFIFIVQHSNEIGKVPETGEPTIALARNIIKKDETRPIILNKAAKPDFVTLEKQLITKYGDIGKQVYLEESALYYYLAKDVANFVAVKNQIHANYPGSISFYDMNNDAWMVFEESDDKSMLLHALSWSKHCLDANPESITDLDTYANLLYKLGRKEEAIKWEEKAVKIDPQDKEISENYEKMKNGKQTWK